MSTIREALVTLNKTHNCVEPLTNVTVFVSAVAKLNSVKLFRDIKPRLISIYRHFDTLPESILDPRDVRDFKDFVVKSLFTGAFFEKEVLSANDYAALDEERLKEVSKNKQLIVTNSDAGRDFWIEMLKVERAYDMMTRRLNGAPIFEMYRTFRINEALRDIRHMFYTSDTVRAEKYVRAFILYMDTVGSNEVLAGDFHSFSNARPKTLRISQEESEEQVNYLVKSLRYAKGVTGKFTIFTMDELKAKGAPNELVNFIAEITAE